MISTMCVKLPDHRHSVPDRVRPRLPRGAIAGVLDLVRYGDGPEVSRTWSKSCVLSGECLKVCDYGVNPRFLLNMARIAMARAKNDQPQQRKSGVDGFRLV